MTGQSHLVVFALDDHLYSLHLSAVKRVIRAVEVTPLPKSPPVVIGVIDLEGTIVPVVSLRRRFRLPEREIEPSDQIVIARTAAEGPITSGGRLVGLVVDSVMEVIEISAERIVAPESIMPGLEYVDGVARLADGLLLIHDLDTFLSTDERRTLDAALAAGVS